MKKMSNKEFFAILQEILDTETDPEFSEENLIKTINEELKKSYLMRDYPLIHECYLTLSECYGYRYNNEYEESAKNQIKRAKKVRELKAVFNKSRTAIF